MATPIGRPRSGALDVVLGGRIRERRIAMSLTQSELGKRIGMTFQQVQKYENGSNRVTALVLVKLARALELGVTDLLNGIDGENSDKAEAQRERLLLHFSNIHSAEVREAVLLMVANLATGPNGAATYN